jgi:hypothetical protein
MSSNAPEIGTKLENQTVYAGVSPSNGRSLYAAPEGAKTADGGGLMMTFREAKRYARKLNKEKYLGYSDWRVPTPQELKRLCAHKDEGALRGTFKLTDKFRNADHWSSEGQLLSGWAFMQNFNGVAGFVGLTGKKARLAVRLVRG